MTNADQQAEELEVLKSIYEGDAAFNAVKDSTFQYKLGEPDSAKSFILEIQWPTGYPMDAGPLVNLEVFYNKHLSPDIKATIAADMADELRNLDGMPATFSIFTFAGENADKWLDDPGFSAASTVPASNGSVSNHGGDNNNDSDSEDDSDSDERKKEAKERKNMTKNAKRRMWDRGEGRGTKERGSDWVDLIKHLSQTGSS